VKPMKLDLLESIQSARQRVRKASAIPLSREETTAEQRRLAVEAMHAAMVETLGYKLMLQLKAESLWTENGAAMRFRVDEQYFLLRKSQQVDQYILFLMREEDEQELLRVDASDPLFTDRILMSIGDYVPATRRAEIL
jgi:YesN/AraC family two-component response regulator